MTPLARVLLDNARAPNAPCGVAVASCFPDAPRVQAALRSFRRDWADAITRDTAHDLAPLLGMLAHDHGIGPWSGTGPAIGVATFISRQTVVMYDGRTWWACTPRGICRVPPSAVRVAYEVI